MKIRPGIDVIETTFFGRPLNVVLFRGEKNALVDTGLVGTPAEQIFPEFKQNGFDAKNLDYVFVTHAHADHFGGNEEIRDASGGKAHFCCHELDRAWIEDPPKATREGYGHYVEAGVMKPEELETGIEVSGNGVKIDTALKGGESFELGHGLELEIFFLPAHSPGNISILEKKNKALVFGESVCGKAQYNTEGQILTVPYYEDLETYLNSVKRFARIDFELLIPSHMSVMTRKEGLEFIKESLDFALKFDREVRGCLRKKSGKFTSIDVWKDLDGLWEIYKADTGMYMLVEHQLNSLLKRKIISGSFKKGFTWKDDSHDTIDAIGEKVHQAIPAD